MPRQKRTLEQQQLSFFAKLDLTSSPIGCWLWTGPTRDGGYGNFTVRMPDGKVETRAHRIAFIWWKGSIPKGKKVLHKRFCNNCRCANPQHLYAGTSKDNANDKVATGRSLFGSKNPKAKAIEFHVRLIKVLYRRGWPISLLGKIFKLSATRIIAGKQWRHVK